MSLYFQLVVRKNALNHRFSVGTNGKGFMDKIGLALLGKFPAVCRKLVWGCSSLAVCSRSEPFADSHDLFGENQYRCGRCSYQYFFVKRDPVHTGISVVESNIQIRGDLNWPLLHVFIWYSRRGISSRRSPSQ